MLFLGDIALPSGVACPLPAEAGSIFQSTVVNLEGGLSETNLSSSKVLYSSMYLSRYLDALDIKVVSLANNHLFDTISQPSTTIRFLDNLGIPHCGAGESLSGASRAVSLQVDGHEVLLAAFGWEVIGCTPATEYGPGANPLRTDRVLATTANLRRCNPRAKIVLLMHWNYELEPYPQPMHRQLAFAAIDAGANAIIGTHPHCVGGIEIHQGAPVVYSLGNWFVPSGVFWGGQLSYPAHTRLQLAFEWSPSSGEIKCHWFEYQPGSHEIRYLMSESLMDSDNIRRLTPFAKLSHGDYIDWFVCNRVKRRGLPVYRDCNDRAKNAARDFYVHQRQRLVDLLFAIGLRSSDCSKGVIDP